MFIFNKYIVYRYNDSSLDFMSDLFRMSGRGNLLNNSSFTLSLENKIDFLTLIIKKSFSYYFDFITVNNLFLILSVILSIYFAFKLFRIVARGIAVALFLTILYSFSIYILYRVISATQMLFFIFVFPAVLYLLLKNKKSFFIGLIVFVFSMISNYYGFFLFVLVCFWYFSDLILKKVFFKNFLKNIFLFSFSVSINKLMF